MVMESILLGIVRLSYFSFSFLAKVKAVNLLVCFSVILGQTSLCQADCRIFKSNIYLEQSEEIPSFFFILIPEVKELIEKYWGWVWSKNGSTHPGHRTFKLAISHIVINRIN